MAMAQLDTVFNPDVLDSLAPRGTSGERGRQTFPKGQLLGGCGVRYIVLRTL